MKQQKPSSSAARSGAARKLDVLMESVRACALCTELPLGPRPILQCHADARILVAGQAPGRRTHEKGRPFDDVSGDRLREWMGLSREQFYDATRIALLPMGFCYPGTGSHGDLPPRPECAAHWRETLLTLLPNIQLTLVIGQYAHRWHLRDQCGRTLTDTVANWRTFSPQQIPLPHPSPRNNIWLKRNPWFEQDLLPVLRTQVAELI